MSRITRKLTRTDVKARLGCSLATVQRLEHQGLLNPTREADTSGHVRVWFDAGEVDAVVQRWAPSRRRAKSGGNADSLEMVLARGQAAQMLFPLFQQRVGFAQIVTQTGIDPALVRQVHRDWQAGFDDERKIEREREEREEERARQRAYEREQKNAEYRAYRLKLAEIEARGREKKA